MQRLFGKGIRWRKENEIHKIQKAFGILRRNGITELLNILQHKRHGWKQYSLSFSPLHLRSIRRFLYSLDVYSDDLVVVPEIYKNSIKKGFRGRVVSTLDLLGNEELDNFSRLIWASDRVDRGAVTARYFYKALKEVIVMRNIGPARVWAHDEVKEKVLISELAKQSKEGIDKFCHGVGADFGNLLQFIDNAKDVEGDFVEIGCFFGSSTCVIADYMERNNISKRFVVYDYFEGFTYRQVENSQDNNWRGSHVTDGKEAVEARVRLRLSSQSGNFEIYKRNIIDFDALKEVQDISFANIDVDMYEAVLAALFHVHGKLCVNGIIVVEDAGHTPLLLGAKIAVEEFLDSIGSGHYHKFQMESGQYVLVRRGERP